MIQFSIAGPIAQTAQAKDHGDHDHDGDGDDQRTGSPIKHVIIIVGEAVSPFSKPGHIAHNYSDHASIVKFIERNWNLPTISNRSRDNMPNPKADEDSPYVPKNSPAISDLFELFDFDHDQNGDHH